jgi:hypothetical protein
MTDNLITANHYGPQELDRSEVAYAAADKLAELMAAAPVLADRILEEDRSDAV